MRPQNEISFAPGWPGISPRWTSSAKTGIGTAASRHSRVWFTLSHGILNEIYYPDADQACIRDAGFIVTDGNDFFSEEKRHTSHRAAGVERGIPAFTVTNVCDRNRYRIEKETVTDPGQPVVLQRVRFSPLQGSLTDYHLYFLLAPHLANHGANNTGWVGEYEGRPMMFAERHGRALALGISTEWAARTVGFVGASDGWQDLHANRRLTQLYDRAENGNVALTAEVDLSDGGAFVLALGFGANAEEAARRVVQSLDRGFNTAKDHYLDQWKEWFSSIKLFEDRDDPDGELDAVSAAVIRACESKDHPGAIVASLSIPWGFDKGDGDLGGYHLVWPRDLVETAGALIAIGADEDARRVLAFLRATQNDDGHWPQNMWTGGRPYWTGVQLDETAFPILLVDMMRREALLGADELERLWPMVARAARFLVTNGPVTLQDRWEEDPGYSPFTLAVTIAALEAAASLAEANDDLPVAQYLLETADAWNEAIERWTYVTDTDLAQQVGVDGYYVRISPPETADATSPVQGFVPIKNRPVEQSSEPAGHLVSPDALALVRFGLRAPDDPRIVNTVRAIDTLLKVDLPGGPAWHRYNDDGYGEHEDGSAFDGTGIGRAWPLLTGERGHYELAAGRTDEAARLLQAMKAFSNEGGLIPEQVWDSPDIPEKELFLGRPSGSAMPLVWAHAEYLKLRRSLKDGRVFDLPARTQSRYADGKSVSAYHIWRFNHKCRTMPNGKALRLETMAPAIVRWSSDEWKTADDLRTKDTGMGIHVADLPTAGMSAGDSVVFTFNWPEAGHWEGTNFVVTIEHAG